MSLSRDPSKSVSCNKITFDFNNIRPITKRRIINNKSLTPIKPISRRKLSESRTLNEVVDNTSSLSNQPKTLSHSQELISYRSAPSLRKTTVETLQQSKQYFEKDLEKLKDLKTYEEAKTMSDKHQNVRNKLKVREYVEIIARKKGIQRSGHITG
jgi:hypothetical protein